MERYDQRRGSGAPRGEARSDSRWNPLLPPSPCSTRFLLHLPRSTSSLETPVTLGPALTPHPREQGSRATAPAHLDRRERERELLARLAAVLRLDAGEPSRGEGAPSASGG